MKPFELEALVIAHVLIFGKRAMGILNSLPVPLTHNKFVFSYTGQFGPDHGLLFQTLQVLCLQGDPDLPGIALNMGNEHREYAAMLVERFKNQYELTELKVENLIFAAQKVEGAGSIYALSAIATEEARHVSTVEAFEQHVKTVKNPDSYLAKTVQRFSDEVQMTKGYVHISTGLENVHDKVRRIQNGEQLTLLPVGMPSLLGAYLMPIKKLVVIQGMTSSGKTSFVQQANLGTAMGLVANRLQGCVAINSFEEDLDELIMKMACVLSGTNMMDVLYNKLSEEEYDRYHEWLDVVGELPLYIDETNLLNISALSWRLSGLHNGIEGPVWALTIDYTELLETDDISEDSRERQLSHIAHKAFAISRTAGASVRLITQSNYSDGIRKSKIAGMNGPRYSKAISHTADILLELWNPLEMERSNTDFEVPEGLDKDHAWLLIEKYRGGVKSPPIPFIWEGEHTRLIDKKLETGVLFEHQQQVFDMLGHIPTKVVSPDDMDYPWG